VSNTTAPIVEVTNSALARIIAGAIRVKRNMAVCGAPGVGKSEGVQQASLAEGAVLIEVRAALMDAVDFLGAPKVVEQADGTFRTVFGRPWFFPEDDGRLYVIFLDEFNRANATVMNACFQLLDQGRVGPHVLPQNCVVIGAYNRETDGGGVTRMPAALSARFGHVQVVPSITEWSTWASANAIDPMVVGFLRFRPNLLHDFDPVARVSPNPRAWKFVSDWLAAGLNPEDLFAIIAGNVGQGAAIEFTAFRDLLKQLPNIDAILLNPGAAPVPTDVGQLYAVSAALAGRATDDNFDRVIQYMDRCPTEYGVFTVRDAVERNPGLASTGAFLDWAVSHQDVLS